MDIELIGTVINLILSLLTAYFGYVLVTKWLGAPGEKEKTALKPLVAGFAYLLAFKILMDSAPLQKYWEQSGVNTIVAAVIVNAIFVAGLGFLIYATSYMFKKK